MVASLTFVKDKVKIYWFFPKSGRPEEVWTAFWLNPKTKRFLTSAVRTCHLCLPVSDPLIIQVLVRIIKVKIIE